MTTAPALLPCPNRLCGKPFAVMRRSPASSMFYGRCDICMCEGPHRETEAEAIAAWNTRSESDGERVREAEDRGYKRAAKMIAALVADAMIYEDSYGVVGSEFPCCMACNAGGAPGINFTHQANCVVLKCETIADDLWQEQRDELNFVNEENERLRAELAALKGASHDQSRATGSAGAAL